MYFRRNETRRYLSAAVELGSEALIEPIVHWRSASGLLRVMRQESIPASAKLGRCRATYCIKEQGYLSDSQCSLPHCFLAVPGPGSGLFDARPRMAEGGLITVNSFIPGRETVIDRLPS